MREELRQHIERTKFCGPVIEQTIELLPPSDAKLDALLAEIVAANDRKAFVFVTVAAAAADRRMDARHLAGGAMMFPEHLWLGIVTMRMQGDVPEHLFAAIENTTLERITEAAALYVVAAWCDEHRGGVLPDRFIPLARATARKLKPNGDSDRDLYTFGFLRALAVRTKDENLAGVLRQRYFAPDEEGMKLLDEKAQDMAESFLVAYRGDVLAMLPEKPAPTIAQGFTMRRAVARVGRNEPCPCGSGKKYKHCCIEKDHARLQHSSDVAGVTSEELNAHLEEHLTENRLAQTPPHDVARLNPAKIPESLWDMYFLRLAAFNLLDRAAEALEKLGWSDKLKEGWENVMFAAVRQGRRDIGQRLFKLRKRHGLKETDLDFPAQLLLAGDDAARCLQLIEARAREVLQSEDKEELLSLAYAVNFSKFPALGILLYRGVIPLMTNHQAARSFEQLLIARDRLNLPPDDPFSDIMDERLTEPKDAGESKDAAELRQAQRSLAVKMQEVGELKNSLERLQKEIASLEKKAAAHLPAVQAPAPTPLPADEIVLKELRRKVEELKSALKERHEERNELRRELQNAQARLEDVQNNAVPPVQEQNFARDAEDALLLPPQETQVQPVRLIEFPKHFAQTLAPFPRHVARAAMQMIGRLASGEPAAFVGALRLKATPNVMRQRIGSDYRLLFRLWPERIEVIDLINRKDLLRRIKTL